MPRIIAGAAKGRRLVTPPGARTRPTADRTREGLFSSLQSIRGPLAGVRFLDLYAGSGAVGFEAASRGAASVTLVEREASAVRAIRTNLATVVTTPVDVRHEPVERFLGGAPARYDVVFLDPPYDVDVEPSLRALTAGGWLADHAVVAVERSRRDGEPTWPAGLSGLRSRRYGDATLCYGARS